MRQWRLFVSAGAAGLLATGLLGAGGAGTAGGATFVSWPQYLYSPGHSSDNTAATTVTTANAASLTRAWRFSSATGGFLSSPVVYNGVIYIGAKNGYFYALNEATGAVIWQRFIGVVPRLTCGRQGFTSTATVAPDPATGNPTIYVYGATGYLYAMNAADGTDVWPPAAVAIPSTTVNDYYAWSSPLVLNGNIYVGHQLAVRRAAGARVAWPSTARPAGRWRTRSGPHRRTRSAPASGPARPPTASRSTSPPATATRTADGFSVVQLSPSLAQEGIWTVPQGQLVEDSDFGGSPGLWTAFLGGVKTPMVGACNKNGTFYALQRPQRCRPGRCGARKTSKGGECDRGAAVGRHAPVPGRREDHDQGRQVRRLGPEGQPGHRRDHLADRPDREDHRARPAWTGPA